MSHVGRSRAGSWCRILSVNGDTHHQGDAQELIRFNGPKRIRCLIVSSRLLCVPLISTLSQRNVILMRTKSEKSRAVAIMMEHYDK